MLSDTHTITIGATPYTLARIGTNERKSTYQTSDKTLTMIVEQLVAKGPTRRRWKVRVEWRKVVTDPLTSANDYDILASERFYDEPEYGFTEADTKAFVTALDTWESDAIVASLFGGQH